MAIKTVIDEPKNIKSGLNSKLVMEALRVIDRFQDEHENQKTRVEIVNKLYDECFETTDPKAPKKLNSLQPIQIVDKFFKKVQVPSFSLYSEEADREALVAYRFPDESSSVFDAFQVSFVPSYFQKAFEPSPTYALGVPEFH